MRNYRKNIKHLLILLFISQFPMNTYGQEKHPRVSEAERFLVDKAFRFLRGRFPNKPIIVTAEIEPLRRVPQTGYSESADLPFGIIEKFDIKDEWDDETKSISELLIRVRSAKVTVRLSKNISDNELNILRNDLFAYLSLIPARDKIDFERKNWERNEQNLYIYWIAGGVFLFFLLSLYLIVRAAASRIASSFQAGGGGEGSGSGSARPAAPPPSMNRPMGGEGISSSKEKSAGSQEMNFNDRISLRNDMRLLIRRLNKHKCFPSLKDLITFNDLAIDNPDTLGAILMEFSLSDQEKLFAISPENKWLPAFTSSGAIDSKCYDVLEKISRTNRDDMQPEWENLLIAAWRLGDNMSQLIRQLERDDAFAILAAIPLNIAIPIARDVFPGAWGILLESDSTFPRIADVDKIKDIENKAFEITPKNLFTQIDTYRRERNLIAYVRRSDISVEKDIYEASGKDAMIKALRPPFYVVFNQKGEIMQELFNQFSLDDWGLALFNTPREKRSNIKKVMSDKQWFLFIELLKKLDQEKPSPDAISAIRDRIAETLVFLIEQKNSQAKEESQGEGKDKKKGKKSSKDKKQETDNQEQPEDDVSETENAA